MKKVISAILIVILSASPALADAETVKNIILGLAAVGAVAAAANQANPHVQELQVQAKNQARSTARDIADTFVKSIPEHKPQQVLEAFCRSYESKGLDAFIADNEFNPGNKMMSASDTRGNMTEIELDETMDTVTVTVSLPDYGVSEKVTKEYNPRKPMPVDMHEKPFNMYEIAGFDVSDKGRSRDGNLILSRIKPGSAMANLGALEGSDLYELDHRATVSWSAQDLRAHVKQRAKDGGKITVTFADINGDRKSIDINVR